MRIEVLLSNILRHIMNILRLMQKKLITAGEEESAYEEILGKNLTELKEEWISSVEALEQQYTLEEIKKIESEFLLK